MLVGVSAGEVYFQGLMTIFSPFLNSYPWPSILVVCGSLGKAGINTIADFNSFISAQFIVCWVIFGFFSHYACQVNSIESEIND